MESEVVVVSGLPRSGTSLMMQMLAAGGVELLTDQVRGADEDNPRGYLEFERVKKLKVENSWLADARGKAIKVVTQLLSDLPPSETYRIVLMRRDLDEVLQSQTKMLSRSGQSGGPAPQLRAAFLKHLQSLEAWLARQPHMSVLEVDYAQVIKQPAEQARRVNEFLGGHLNTTAMAAAVDPTLYRNQR